MRGAYESLRETATSRSRRDRGTDERRTPRDRHIGAARRQPQPPAPQPAAPPTTCAATACSDHRLFSRLSITPAEGPGRDQRAAVDAAQRRVPQAVCGGARRCRRVGLTLAEHAKPYAGSDIPVMPIGGRLAPRPAGAAAYPPPPFQPAADVPYPHQMAQPPLPPHMVPQRPYRVRRPIRYAQPLARGYPRRSRTPACRADASSAVCPLLRPIRSSPHRRSTQLSLMSHRRKRRRPRTSSNAADRGNPRQPARIPRGGARTHRDPRAPPLLLSHKIPRRAEQKHAGFEFTAWDGALTGLRVGIFVKMPRCRRAAAACAGQRVEDGHGRNH